MLQLNIISKLGLPNYGMLGLDIGLDPAVLRVWASRRFMEGLTIQGQHY